MFLHFAALSRLSNSARQVNPLLYPVMLHKPPPHRPLRHFCLPHISISFYRVRFRNGQKISTPGNIFGGPRTPKFQYPRKPWGRPKVAAASSYKYFPTRTNEPVERVRIRFANLAGRKLEGLRFIPVGDQRGIEKLHEIRRAAIVYIPQRQQHRLRSGVQQAALEADQLVAPDHHIQAGAAAAQCHQFGRQLNWYRSNRLSSSRPGGWRKTWDCPGGTSRAWRCGCSGCAAPFRAAPRWSPARPR